MVQGVTNGDAAPYGVLHSPKQLAGPGSNQRSIPTAIYAMIIAMVLESAHVLL